MHEADDSLRRCIAEKRYFHAAIMVQTCQPQQRIRMWRTVGECGLVGVRLHLNADDVLDILVCSGLRNMYDEQAARSWSNTSMLAFLFICRRVAAAEGHRSAKKLTKSLCQQTRLHSLSSTDCSTLWRCIHPERVQLTEEKRSTCYPSAGCVHRVYIIRKRNGCGNTEYVICGLATRSTQGT